ncbi:hypothetical protein B0H14DRAFT_2605345 [Mycena olivaceomarginata]|nr:hypothetical protein B0H14DRAFT_2605345 [Mycena olivaceomarginata]
MHFHRSTWLCHRHHTASPTAQSTAIPPTADPPARNSLTLDALTFCVLPGDPSSDVYNNQLPDQFTSIEYSVGHVSGVPQILDDGHSSRVITVGVMDYVRGDTKASAVQSSQPYLISVPTRVLLPTTVEAQPAFRLLQLPLRNGGHSSIHRLLRPRALPHLFPRPRPLFSHSYLGTVIASVPPVLDPISTGDPMYYHPQYFAGIPPALGLPAQSLPDAGLFSIPVAFPWFTPLTTTQISDPVNVTTTATNLSSAPPARVQDNSAFNRSAANTYSYRIPQIPPERQFSVNSTAPPLEPADSGVDHTVKHAHTYSNVHRIFDLIDSGLCCQVDKAQTSVRVRT